MGRRTQVDWDAHQEVENQRVFPVVRQLGSPFKEVPKEQQEWDCMDVHVPPDIAR